jgi:hypothetical protein
VKILRFGVAGRAHGRRAAAQMGRQRTANRARLGQLGRTSSNCDAAWNAGGIREPASGNRRDGDVVALQSPSTQTVPSCARWQENAFKHPPKFVSMAGGIFRSHASGADA